MFECKTRKREGRHLNHGANAGAHVSRKGLGLGSKPSGSKNGCIQLNSVVGIQAAADAVVEVLALGHDLRYTAQGPEEDGKAIRNTISSAALCKDFFLG